MRKELYLIPTAVCCLIYSPLGCCWLQQSISPPSPTKHTHTHTLTSKTINWYCFQFEGEYFCYCCCFHFSIHPLKTEEQHFTTSTGSPRVKSCTGGSKDICDTARVRAPLWADPEHGSLAWHVAPASSRHWRRISSCFHLTHVKLPLWEPSQTSK